MNTKQAQEWIEEAQPLIQFVEDQRGPRIPQWCLAKDGAVMQTCVSKELGEGVDMTCVALNPTAVVAAVCMWVMDLADCVRRTHYKTGGFINPSGQESYEEWRWTFNGHDGLESTKELAFLALLKAICKALGYKGASK